MNEDQSVLLFQHRTIRRHWNSSEERWYFSVIDIIQVLTGSYRPRKYWRDLKTRLCGEGSEVSEKIGQLKMTSADGKSRLTDVADTQTLLRLIQSIPSPNAEPFKLWLAQVGYERIEETTNPELAIDRATKTYLRKGYSKDWVNQRLKSIEIRKELTEEWNDRGMHEGAEFAILTDEITKAWAGRTVKDYKKLKNLKRENLRDNMTTLELVLTMLAEASTSAISEKKKPEGLGKNKQVAQEGGKVAGVARAEIEKQTGESVITSDTAKTLHAGTKPSLKKV